jgi:hypothetical protein
MIDYTASSNPVLVHQRTTKVSSLLLELGHIFCRITSPGNMVGDLKAKLNNPSTSKEAKQHCKEAVDNESCGGYIDSPYDWVEA